MPKLKPGTVLPTPAEDEAITAAAEGDPDSTPLSDAQWNAVRPLVRMGRPLSDHPKQRITIRLSQEVVEAFRRTGDGWQTRIDAALKQYLSEHPL